MLDSLEALLQQPGIVAHPLPEAAAFGSDLSDMKVVVGAGTHESVAQAQAGLTQVRERAVIG